MLSFDAILAARSSDDQFFKLIFGAIVVFFWVVGGISSALKKRAEENRRRARYGQLPNLPPAAPAPVPPQPAMSFPFPPPPVPVPPKSKPRRPAKRPAPAAAPPPPPRQAEPAAFTRVAPTTTAAPVAHRPGGTSTAASPSQIARLLRRPESLRAAMILNEVLSPPLCLREHNAGDGSRP